MSWLTWSSLVLAKSSLRLLNWVCSLSFFSARVTRSWNKYRWTIYERNKKLKVQLSSKHPYQVILGGSRIFQNYFGLQWFTRWNLRLRDHWRHHHNSWDLCWCLHWSSCSHPHHHHHRYQSLPQSPEKTNRQLTSRQPFTKSLFNKPKIQWKS